jgi:hypothetical protein
MVYKSLRAVIVGALMTVGCLATAYAAPIAPAATIAPPAPVKLVSFWGWPFPHGYTYLRGQCYMPVQVDTPNGPVWRRVWICTEAGSRSGFGYGYVGRF